MADGFSDKTFLQNVKNVYMCLRNLESAAVRFSGEGNYSKLQQDVDTANSTLKASLSVVENLVKQRDERGSLLQAPLKTYAYKANGVIAVTSSILFPKKDEEAPLVLPPPPPPQELLPPVPIPAPEPLAILPPPPPPAEDHTSTAAITSPQLIVPETPPTDTTLPWTPTPSADATTAEQPARKNTGSEWVRATRPMRRISGATPPTLSAIRGTPFSESPSEASPQASVSAETPPPPVQAEMVSQLLQQPAPNEQQVSPRYIDMPAIDTSDELAARKQLLRTAMRELREALDGVVESLKELRLMKAENERNDVGAVGKGSDIAASPAMLRRTASAGEAGGITLGSGRDTIRRGRIQRTVSLDEIIPLSQRAVAATGKLVELVAKKATNPSTVDEDSYKAAAKDAQVGIGKLADLARAFGLEEEAEIRTVGDEFFVSVKLAYATGMASGKENLETQLQKLHRVIDNIASCLDPAYAQQRQKEVSEDEQKRKLAEQNEKFLRMRGKAVKELLSTERSYIGSLKLAQQLYVRPLKQLLQQQKEPMLSQEEYNTLFVELERIIALGTDLVKRLEERLQPASTGGTATTNAATPSNGASTDTATADYLLGDFFVKWSPWLKLYASYVVNFDACLKLLQALPARPAWSAFVKGLQEEWATYNQPVDLGSFLIMPVQRLPRYELLLKEILKWTQQTHPDYRYIIESLDRIKTVNEQINLMKRDRDNMNRILYVQTHLLQKDETQKVDLTVGGLGKGKRLYLREGPMGYLFIDPAKTSSSSRSKAKPKSYYCIMFDDLMIVAKTKKGGMYSVKRVVPFFDAELIGEGGVVLNADDAVREDRRGSLPPAVAMGDADGESATPTMRRRRAPTTQPHAPLIPELLEPMLENEFRLRIKSTGAVCFLYADTSTTKQLWVRDIESSLDLMDLSKLSKIL